MIYHKIYLVNNLKIFLAKKKMELFKEEENQLNIQNTDYKLTKFLK